MWMASIQPILPQDPTTKRLIESNYISREMIEMAGGAGSSNGTGGMLTKPQGSDPCDRVRVPVYICSSLKSDALIEAAESKRMAVTSLQRIRA